MSTPTPTPPSPEYDIGDTRTLRRSGASELQLESMLDSQKKILKRVVFDIHQIAQQSNYLQEGVADGFHTGGSPESVDYNQLIETAHPSLSFLIDGPRGSGKTSLILTIRRVIWELGRPEDSPTRKALHRVHLRSQLGLPDNSNLPKP